MADATEWARRVAQWRRSGMTTAEFCAGRDYSASTLRWYSSRLGQGSAAPRTAMLRVRREPSPAASRVVVELGDARVHVAPGADAETLAAVFDALRGAREEA